MSFLPTARERFFCPRERFLFSPERRPARRKERGQNNDAPPEQFPNNSLTHSDEPAMESRCGALHAAQAPFCRQRREEKRFRVSTSHARLNAASPLSSGQREEG